MMREAKRRGCQVVAHNATFDVNRLNHTADVHHMLPIVHRKEVLCTMVGSTVYCNLKRVDGQPKVPTNEELYQFLFGEEVTGVVHDALADARITAQSYIEGRERGWWP